MIPKWLIQTEIFHENQTALVAAVKAAGMQVETVDYLPYSGHEEWLNLFPPDDCVIFYGSLAFARHIKKLSKWIPGVYYDLTNYNCLGYYPQLGSLLLAQEYVMLPFGDLRRQKKFLYKNFSHNNSIFIRPNSGNKLFTGYVIAESEFDTELSMLDSYNLAQDTLIVVSAARELAAEWRFVVVNGQIITGSQYKQGEDLHVSKIIPDAALQLAQHAAIMFMPTSVWCLDICQLKSGEYFVLEVGSFSCCGLYGCDLTEVVKHVSAAAFEEWEQYN